MQEEHTKQTEFSSGVEPRGAVLLRIIVIIIIIIIIIIADAFVGGRMLASGSSSIL